ncbi:MAG: BON domain-containing protein [Planctomycetota bacterium]|nr:BON domain-containing protein [Planctomycetota bacterium]
MFAQGVSVPTLASRNNFGVGLFTVVNHFVEMTCDVGSADDPNASAEPLAINAIQEGIMRRKTIGIMFAALAFFIGSVLNADDEKIANHLYKKLSEAKQQGSLKDFSLDMEVKEGIVYFSGRVASKTQKSLVLTMAQKAQELGVVEIRDGISIAAKPAAETKPAKEALANSKPEKAAKPAAKPEPSQDEQIAKHLYEKLSNAKQDGSLKDFTLDMEVKSGVVYFRGQVGSKSHKNLVLTLAQQAKGLGVVEIRDNISVTEKPAPKASPAKRVPETSKVAAKPEKVAAKPAKAQPKPEKAQPKPEKAQPKPEKVAAKPKPTAATSSRIRHKPAPKLVQETKPVAITKTAQSTKPTQNFDYLDQAQSQTATAAKATTDSSRVQQASATKPVQEKPRVAVTQPAQYTQPADGIDYVSNRPSRVAPAQQVVAQPAPAQQIALLPARAAAPRAPLPVQGQAALQAPNYMPASAANGARYDSPGLPNYAWPSYAPHPNYGAVTYPKTYSPTAWPYIGPFYPYPQVPLGWRKVTLQWDDGWWYLDFKDR